MNFKIHTSGHADIGALKSAAEREFGVNFYFIDTE